MDVFPHRGAYCARVNLGKNGTNAYLDKIVSWAADSTNYVSFKFMVGEDVQIGNDGDLVDIFRLYSGVDEGALALSRIEPAGLVLGLRDASGSVLDYLKIEAAIAGHLEARISWPERALLAAIGTALLWPTGLLVNVPGQAEGDFDDVAMKNVNGDDAWCRFFNVHNLTAGFQNAPREGDGWTSPDEWAWHYGTISYYRPTGSARHTDDSVRSSSFPKEQLNGSPSGGGGWDFNNTVFLLNGRETTFHDTGQYRPETSSSAPSEISRITVSYYSGLILLSPAQTNGSLTSRTACRAGKSTLTA
jgi:hypothetical protein